MPRDASTSSSGARADYQYLIKLLLIGDSGVGKSCLLLRFSDDSFTTSFITTIGIDFKIKKVQFDDGVKVKLQLWDTAGQERFRTITSAYYRGAMGIVLTYDITDEASFTAIRNWVKNVESNAAADVNRILVGNKSDMEKQRVVSTERGQALADEFGLKFFETSAKSGAGVEESFRELAWQVKERLSANSETAGAGKASTTGGKASSSRVKAEGSTGRKLSFWGSARKYSSGDGSSRRRGTKCSGSRGSCSGASASS